MLEIKFETVLEALKTSDPKSFEAVLTAAVKQIANEVLEDIEAKQREHEHATVSDTEHLLAHYHHLKAAHEDAIYNLETLPERDDVHYAEIDDMMRRIISTHDVKIESIEKSAARTHLYMLEIDAALKSYERYCLLSEHENQKRRWRVLKARYLAMPRKSTQQIAQEEYVDVRTVQRDLRAALKEMTVRLFGVDGLKLLAS